MAAATRTAGTISRQLIISSPSVRARPGGGWLRHDRVYQIDPVAIDKETQPAADCLARETAETVTAKQGRLASCRAAGLGHPKMPNAPKLNNAWWRWFGSGPRNPPVIIRLHGSAKVHHRKRRPDTLFRYRNPAQMCKNQDLCTECLTLIECAGMSSPREPRSNPGQNIQTSSHSLQMTSFALSSAGVPSNTMRP
jgi:hypothetical protein